MKNIAFVRKLEIESNLSAYKKFAIQETLQ